MSIETLIAENTAALNRLSALLEKSVPVKESATLALGKLGSADPDYAPPAAQKEEVGKPIGIPADKPKATGENISFDDLAVAFRGLLKANRDAAVALLGEFKVEKLSGIEPADYVAVRARISELLA